MKLEAVSIFVDDQQRAVDFYTGRLGFAVSADIPMGEHRWLTVIDPDRPEAPQISLEPKGHPAVAPFTEALIADGIPFCVLGVDEAQRADRLTSSKRELCPWLRCSVAVRSTASGPGRPGRAASAAR